MGKLKVREGDTHYRTLVLRTVAPPPYSQRKRHKAWRPALTSKASSSSRSLAELICTNSKIWTAATRRLPNGANRLISTTLSEPSTSTLQGLESPRKKNIRASTIRSCSGWVLPICLTPRSRLMRLNRWLECKVCRERRNNKSQPKG